MKWPLGWLLPLDVVVDPLDASHAHCMAQLHAGTFSRPWTDGEFHDLLSKPAVFGYVARELRWGKARILGFVLARAAAGEAEGLDAGLAMALAKATVAGAGALAEAAEESPTQLRINVTSPNGTTQAALEVLMDAKTGLPPLMRRAVKAAADRSRELGK